ncbi:type I-E CRISPR-associated protein Cas7/Cse4/CasC [Williamsia sp. CHRR-6]|uniref:type I-E CRISPR-associated protein Cas7/Cse4/CasC n=1 Tax=Williamsia sp. CHRR-6 TaxID=2835871 RepID=UPI001BD92C99|nr:type I-E CRISPR-associated protein Cas7/Cse4/CasC [Williamsia sp. CHRR-6]MBT0566993.1 type I-E CRISPR-associated protein Cas7/Cse4/CasC [Williamsia sp. CHRR-6]
MFIDIHILQSVPPSNINRDDTGSPKTAIYGGVRRARVSSQSWKRATRKRFNDTLDKSEIGFRTKRLSELLGERIRERVDGLEPESAYALASSIFKAAGKTGIKMVAPKVAKNAPAKPDESQYLVFLSAAQLKSLADLAATAHRDGAEVDKKRVKEIFTADNSIDVALFGRMIADDAELNVDASVQVAHAISVHAVEQEFDYFTAVDDFGQANQEPGAGMIGTIEFASSTLYRFATINIAGLEKNLGDRAATARAAAAFVESFARSMPSGKVNTFANYTLPEVVLINIRNDQPVSLVGAFEDPIATGAEHGGIPARATAELVRRDADIAKAYGSPAASFFTAAGVPTDLLATRGEDLEFASLVQRVSDAVTAWTPAR